MTRRMHQGGEGAPRRFRDTGRTHVLMITNHGLHEWQVTPGLPDTGGQNIYVNQFTDALIELGYRVTIVNRGGYAHPGTGARQEGVRFHPTGHARILYLEDGLKEFVRKEDMDEQVELLAEDLLERLRAEEDAYDLILSHYWDAGKLGNLLNARSERRVPHVWVPHSLGALKKRNVDPGVWAGLRIDERIEHEREILRHVNGAVATSAAIRDTLVAAYGYPPEYFLPPCINENRYRPREAAEVEPIYDFLAGHCALGAEEIKRRKLITEISRTDTTKRKDVLLRAFAAAKRQVPDALLAVTIDPSAAELHVSLQGLIDELGLRDDVIVLGSVWNELPLIYNAASIYCTPSVMEGFGMTAQEAAATGKPVVSSDLVPFAVEYLAGPSARPVVFGTDGDRRTLKIGEAAIVASNDDIQAFAHALIHLLEDEELRRRLGQRAREITVPYFTWTHMASRLMSDLGVSDSRGAETGVGVVSE